MSHDGDCPQCGRHFTWRSFPLGISIEGNKIQIEGEFCTTSCAKRYAMDTKLLPDAKIISATTVIMNDYIEHEDEHDNHDNILYISKYSSFMQVPAAPKRLMMKRYGGSFTDEDVWSEMKTGIIKQAEIRPMQTAGSFMSRLAKTSVK